MPAGNITTVEKMQRLNMIKQLKDEGKSQHQIAEDLGMSLPAVKRNLKYLNELEVGSLSPEVVTEKRIELDQELAEASEEARMMYFRYKDQVATMVVKDTVVQMYDHEMARRFHKRWTETLIDRAKIYGLDNIKIEAFAQINTQNNINTDGEGLKLSPAVLDKIADAIIDSHVHKV